MLLTITYTGENATDLGFLLHKNPQRPQAFELSYGKAYVFYPEACDAVCTAALLLDVDPLDLARGKIGSRDGGLFDYVNDRPYVSSSFMSTAISRVFGTAMSGRCDKRQALVESELDLSASVTMLPFRGDKEMLTKVFEPLGYSVRYETGVLYERYETWGQSPYVNLSLSGHVKLQALLRHLYVLLPVFDRQKHYWIGVEEIEKLLRHGEGWLEAHPEKEFIAKRYFKNKYSFARIALDRMDDGESGATSEETEDADVKKQPTLNAQRLDAVVEALKASGAHTVIDMGCGEGNLLALLLQQREFTQIAGTDVSFSVLERAKARLKLDKMPETQKNRLTLFQSSLTYRDSRFSGHDAAAVVEVIEHLDAGRLAALERVVFGETQPKTVLVTTPNIEYNKNFETLPAGKLRHGDHRFEWTRDEFAAWGNRVAGKYGYTVEYGDIGDASEADGAPTQMGVFSKCE